MFLHIPSISVSTITIIFTSYEHCLIVAAQRGHTLALYKLAHISKNGYGVVKSCGTAVSGFKAVAERSRWSRGLTVARRVFEKLKPADDSSRETFHQLEISDRLKMFDEQSMLKRRDIDKQQPQYYFSLLKHFLLNSAIAKLYTFVFGYLSHDVNKNDYNDDRLIEDSADHVYMNNLDNRNFALSLYSQLASMGYEIAQTNAAHILSKSVCPPWTSQVTRQSDQLNYPMNFASSDEYLVLKFPSLVPHYDPSRNEASHIDHISCDVRSLLFYGSSAVQGNTDAFIRVGDFFYYGRAGMVRNKPNAVRFYQLAASQRHGHAIFNLGMMYEIGDCVSQDFHLAKRFFDQAAEFEYNARIPCSVALFLLGCHKLLNSFIGSKCTTRIILMLMESLIQVGKFSELNSLLHLYPDERIRMNMFSGNYLKTFFLLIF